MLKRIFATFLFLFCIGLCACSAQPGVIAQETAPAQDPLENAVYSSGLSAMTAPDNFSAPSASKNFFQQNPPSIAVNVLEKDGSYLFLPHVMNSVHADSCNDRILALAEAALKELGRSVYADYTIETNNGRFLSLALRFYDMESGFSCGVYSATFDLRTGKEYRLAEYFNDDDGRWRRVLPDIVTQQAKRQGMTLLSELLPITDEQGFFIRGADLVLIYHPYEITTFETGVPEFSIPISSLTELLADDSALWTLIDDNTESAKDDSAESSVK